MLVLTRKEGEKILIGEDITVTVVKSKNGQVRIGIQAPKGVSIYREEIAEKEKQSQEENLEADKKAA